MNVLVILFASLNITLINILFYTEIIDKHLMMIFILRACIIALQYVTLWRTVLQLPFSTCSWYNCINWSIISDHNESTNFLEAFSLQQGCLHDVLRQCRARIRRHYRVKCVSLEQTPAEWNAATRERNTLRVRFLPGLSPSTAHPFRYKQFNPKTRCGSWAEGRKSHAGDGN